MPSHFFLLEDLEGMMLGGSNLKLSIQGENLEKVMPGLFFSEVVDSTRVIKLS